MYIYILVPARTEEVERRVETREARAVVVYPVDANLDTQKRVMSHDLYTIFVCYFRDWALVNSIIGTKLLLYFVPCISPTHNIAQCIVHPRPLSGVPGTIQYW